MAPPSRSGSRPGRALAGLAVLVLVMFFSITGSQTFNPGNWHKQFKVGLGLDLSSGTEVVLKAATTKGVPVKRGDAAGHLRAGIPGERHRQLRCPGPAAGGRPDHGDRPRQGRAGRHQPGRAPPPSWPSGRCCSRSRTPRRRPPRRRRAARQRVVEPVGHADAAAELRHLARPVDQRLAERDRQPRPPPTLTPPGSPGAAATATQHAQAPAAGQQHRQGHRQRHAERHRHAERQCQRQPGTRPRSPTATPPR